MGDNKKIGVLINNVDGRYQSLILKGFEEYSKLHPFKFYFFIGRSINSPNDGEQLYNFIYNLSKSDKIDGIISISGAIGNYLSSKDLNNYLKNFYTKPMVSIGAIIDGIPSIVTDNFGGMFSVVDHIITNHDVEKIGFVSGPETNAENLERFKGYKEAIKKNSFKLDNELIFKGDFSYNSFNKFLNKLVVNGSLTCDALICANDEMALGISNELNKLGFKSPKDYLITGFDNILDSNFMTAPLTTVHQPLIEQAFSACTILELLFNNKDVPMITKVDTKLIIRESCGCNAFIPIKSRINKSIDRVDRSRIINLIITDFNNEKSIQDDLSKLVPTLIDNIILDINSFRKEPIFLYALSDWLKLTTNWNYYFDIWNKILNQCQSTVLDYYPNINEKNYINELFKRGYSELVLKNTHNLAEKLKNTEVLLYLLRETSDKFNYCNSLEDIYRIINEEFGKFGIKNTYIVLHNQKSSQGNNASDLIDKLPYEDKSSEDYFVLPLLYNDQYYGYVVFEKSNFEPIIYESLSREVSKTLHNTNKNKLIEDKLYNLQDNKTRLDSIFEMIPMMIMDTDLNTGILFKNNFLHNELTRNGQSVRSLRSVIPNEDLKIIDSLKWKIKNKDTFLKYPGVRLIDEINNRYIPVAQISGLFNKNNEIIGFRWFVFDAIPLIKDTVLPDNSFYIEKNISKREKDVIGLILQGLSIRSIAKELFISESTVKGHMSRIYSKFKVTNKIELVQEIQNYQVDKHGYSHYLFSVMNSLLSVEK